jgi:uncharacterized membrane protein
MEVFEKASRQWSWLDLTGIKHFAMKLKTMYNRTIVTVTVVLMSSFLLISMTKNEDSASIGKYEVEQQQSMKEQALTVLKNKCNKCHVKQNPFKVFTSRNMDRLARQIERQVFTLKRMPKGNTVKLTSEERVIIRNWINTTK